eukprot:NODE_608_length_6066_cov_0.184347.p5 type:complete len:108 gc:universal NODE_608_length_6066_cov_0.184347:189-512(+)
MNNSKPYYYDRYNGFDPNVEEIIENDDEPSLRDHFFKIKCRIWMCCSVLFMIFALSCLIAVIVLDSSEPDYNKRHHSSYYVFVGMSCSLVLALVTFGIAMTQVENTK